MARDAFQPRRCARMLAALAAPERLRIVRFLAVRSRTVTQIASMLEIPAVNVSHHLNVLKLAGLIRGKKRGRFVDYTLCPGVHVDRSIGGRSEELLNLGCCRLELPSVDHDLTRKRHQI